MQQGWRFVVVDLASIVESVQLAALARRGRPLSGHARHRKTNREIDFEFRAANETLPATFAHLILRLSGADGSQDSAF